VRVLNRTKDSDRVIWSGSFTADEARKDATNPFVFRATSFVLSPGLYTLATTTTSAVGNRFYDESAENATRGRRADTPYVVATGSVWGPPDRVDEVFSAAGVEANGALYIAATLVFDILDNGAPALPANVYDDCESVACANLPSGTYNIKGALQVCDNDNEGGGWMRLWSAENFPCETTAGWTSSRSIRSSTDRLGCRVAPPKTGCTAVSTPVAPFAFNEVRHSGFAIYGLGSPDAFGFTQDVADGVLAMRGGVEHVAILVRTSLSGQSGLVCGERHDCRTIGRATAGAAADVVARRTVPRPR